MTKNGMERSLIFIWLERSTIGKSARPCPTHPPWSLTLACEGSVRVGNTNWDKVRCPSGHPYLMDSQGTGTYLSFIFQGAVQSSGILEPARRLRHPKCLRPPDSLPGKSQSFQRGRSAEHRDTKPICRQTWPEATHPMYGTSKLYLQYIDP